MNIDSDFWIEKYGSDTKSAICEICHETTVYKETSHFGFVQKSNNLLLQCEGCFIKRINRLKRSIPNKNEEPYSQKTIEDPYDLHECIEKMPGRFFLWDHLFLTKGCVHCSLCNIELERLRSFIWYKQLPHEGGIYEFENFTSVCEDCLRFLQKRERGVFPPLK